MRHMAVCLAVAALALLFAFAAYAESKGGLIPGIEDMPGPDPVEIGRHITVTAPYQGWALWPGKGKFYPATEPRGALITTYLNETAAGSIEDGRGMAAGSMIVKEAYSLNKQLVAVCVMYKVKGYNTEGGDWYWAVYGPEGGVQMAGTIEKCVVCHSSKESNGFVLTGSVTAKKP